MHEASSSGASSRRRGPVAVAILATLLVAGWTVAWTWARGRLIDEVDARLTDLASAGVKIVCPDRAVAGWPFRFELSCRDPGVEIVARGSGGSVAALRVVAQVWDPKLMLLEADGPLVAEGADHGRVDASWRRLVLSVRWHPGGIDRVSVSVDGVDARVRDPAGRGGHLAAEHLELHGRTTGAIGNDLDVAVSAAAAKLEIEGRRIGPPRADVSLEATLREMLPVRDGPPLPVFAARGGRIDPVRAGFSVGGVSVVGKGALTLGADGLLDGVISFAARGLEAVATESATLGAETASLLGAFVLLGKASHDPDLPGRRLDLVIDHGRPRFGRLLLPQMEPLFGP